MCYRHLHVDMVERQVVIDTQVVCNISQTSRTGSLNPILVHPPSPPQVLRSMSQYTLIVLQKLQVQHKAASILITICITVTCKIVITYTCPWTLKCINKHVLK